MFERRNSEVKTASHLALAWPSMHAVEFLKSPPPTIPGVIALSGEERSLKLSVLDVICKSVLGEDETPTRFAGKDVQLQTVRSELQTVPMWGGKRVIVIEDASDFVTENRAALEAYVGKPAKKSLLILDLKSFPSNTKLYKSVNSTGLVVDCSPLKGTMLNRWLQDALKAEHNKSLTPDAAALLIELAGTNLGHLEQELAKLAAYAGDKPTVDAASVRKLVGDWKTETTWAMTDAVRENDLPEALHALEKLLIGGDAPLKIHGGIAYVFRKMAIATETSRQGTPLNEALAQAGAWGGEVQPAMRYLKQIGRPKAELLLRKLLDADVNLKGGSSLNDRTQLELLLCRLAGQVD